ncbi:MAG: EscU/YscU/HrcU family type III secretion system export apparatus switch protein [Myxococcales bacterium]|nr:EscU/YscU/HrcU family type III secretion system export apparatus switch protein [Myxococcales bacterium]
MASEKTEEATPKKLREARRKGEVAKSRDLQAAAVLLVVAAALYLTGAPLKEHLAEGIRLALRAVEDCARGEFAPRATLEAIAGLAALGVAPLLLSALVAGAGVGFLQVGGLVAFRAAAPKAERVDPMRGLKNLFSQKQLVELLKGLFAIGLVSYVVWSMLAGHLRGVLGLAARDAAAALEGTGALVLGLMLRVAGAVLALGAVDFLYQRWRFRQDQKMSKDEVKREQREDEGDPHAEQHRDRLYRELVERDALAEVRHADLLVTSPGEVAVALRYDAEADDAPVVLARGREALVDRFGWTAQLAEVPIVHDARLAHALCDLGEGEEIPERLYESVAVALREAWAARGEDAR